MSDEKDILAALDFKAEGVTLFELIYSGLFHLNAIYVRQLVEHDVIPAEREVEEIVLRSSLALVPFFGLGENAIADFLGQAFAELSLSEIIEKSTPMLINRFLAMDLFTDWGTPP